MQKACQKNLTGFKKERQRPTLPLLRSTIGANGLNFSVRDGKRWNPIAIITIRLLSNNLGSNIFDILKEKLIYILLSITVESLRVISIAQL